MKRMKKMKRSKMDEKERGNKKEGGTEKGRGEQKGNSLIEMGLKKSVSMGAKIDTSLLDIFHCHRFS